ncbi:Tetratricopeptide repeat protein 25 [Phlyctochytrium planicorne]|nr:Tetratricopeptide repeat protein 25 [Phlyctochytrium planicorne]
MTADAKAPAPPPPGGDDESESPENLVAKFQTLAAEGDLLSKKRSFSEAIDIFTRALEIRPTDKHCLVARSQCYIQIGAADLALQDADAALKEFPDYFKAILQKAEALYAKGDFELALMHFHRGNRQRPELDEFRVGIQKAREAIENSIGHPTDFKISAVTMTNNSGTQQGVCQPTNSQNNSSGTNSKPSNQNTAPNNIGGLATGNNVNRLSPSMESKLLGELYDDKCYLQSLVNDRDFVDHPDSAILDLVTEGLRYLSTRVDFWKQQNPLYARPKVKRIKPRLERAVHHHHTPHHSNDHPQTTTSQTQRQQQQQQANLSAKGPRASMTGPATQSPSSSAHPAATTSGGNGDGRNPSLPSAKTQSKSTVAQPASDHPVQAQ